MCRNLDGHITHFFVGIILFEHVLVQTGEAVEKNLGFGAVLLVFETTVEVLDCAKSADARVESLGLLPLDFEPRIPNPEVDLKPLHRRKIEELLNICLNLHTGLMLSHLLRRSQELCFLH